MQITKEFLKSKNACESGLEWVTEHNLLGLNSIDFLNKLIELDKLDWANWLIVRVMERKQYIAYAIFAAEQVIDIYEEKHPDNKKPREAIEAAKKVLENDSEENRAAAEAAAYDVYEAAAYDAESAAYDAYEAAVYSAEAAAYDAESAAYYAESAATVNTGKKMKLKILNYGMSLLRNRGIQ